MTYVTCYVWCLYVYMVYIMHYILYSAWYVGGRLIAESTMTRGSMYPPRQSTFSATCMLCMIQ